MNYTKIYFHNGGTAEIYWCNQYEVCTAIIFNFSISKGSTLKWDARDAVEIKIELAQKQPPPDEENYQFCNQNYALK